MRQFVICIDLEFVTDLLNGPNGEQFYSHGPMYFYYNYMHYARVPICIGDVCTLACISVTRRIIRVRSNIVGWPESRHRWSPLITE